MFKDKTLLITGGTGSFGNAVLRRFLEYDLREIRIFSRDEKKQDDMRQQYNNPKIKYYIGDVRDVRSVDSAMVGVDMVFHAAALKQVPSCEFFPLEAVKTNVIGCDNVIDSAVRHGVKKVIVLSTDKAVYPINAMGMSKALSEKVMVARSRNLSKTDTVLCGTRYGNVMASRGSVIPLFIDQIKKGDNITITDADMTRFMMSIDEAVSLVVYAYENGRGGDIFVQKSPACTVGVLASALLYIHGASNDIKVIGTRHGEKLFETLVNKEEMGRVVDEGEYYRICADTRDLNYDKFFTKGVVRDTDEYTSHNTRRMGIDETVTLLKSIGI